jgi:hypothetical protein
MDENDQSTFVLDLHGLEGEIIAAKTDLLKPEADIAAIINGSRNCQDIPLEITPNLRLPRGGTTPL